MSKYFKYIIDHPEIDRADLRLICRCAPRAGRILDIGCGRGSFLMTLRKVIKEWAMNFEGRGIDIDSDVVSYCKQKGLAVTLGDGTKTKFKSGTFDVVRAKEVLEHLHEPEKLIIESKRILKKDGLLVLHVPTQYSTIYPLVNFWDDYTHVRPFTKTAINRLLLVSGFRIIKIEGYTIGRNWIENIICRILAIFLPFEWRVVARKN